MFIQTLAAAACLLATVQGDSSKIDTKVVYDDGIISLTETKITSKMPLHVTVKNKHSKLNARNAYTDTNHLWPNGNVPFIFDENVPAFTKVELLAAMQEIETSTYSGGKNCVTFVPWTDEADYVHIAWTSGTHGSTGIGRSGGQQDITVNSAGGRGHDDNLYIFMLALGLIPEVMRTDRNNFLNININNAVSSTPFRILTGQGTSAFGQPFDFDSLLLGTPYQYAKDASMPVTSAKVDGKVMGQSLSLSAGDATLLQHAYTCAIDSSNIMNILGTLPIECHFHTDICSMTQDSNDDFDWVVQAGPTTTSGTGPNADYSSGSGKFALAEARNHHNKTARLITQQLPAGEYCLRANIHQFGADEGKLRISVVPADGSNSVDILNHNGALGPAWYHVYLTITVKVAVSIQFEATIGGGDQGDIALDDVYVYKGECIQW